MMSLVYSPLLLVLILNVLLAGPATAPVTTTPLAMATMVVAGPSTTTLGYAFIVGSLGCSREVLAQLNNLGELVVVTSEHVLGGGRNPGNCLGSLGFELLDPGYDLLPPLVQRVCEGTCDNPGHVTGSATSSWNPFCSCGRA